MWALGPFGLARRPRRWLSPSLSSHKRTVVLRSLSSPAQTVNICCQMRDCLRSPAPGTRGNGIIGLKTWTLFDCFVGIFIGRSLSFIHLFVFPQVVSFCFFVPPPSFGVLRKNLLPGQLVAVAHHCGRHLYRTTFVCNSILKCLFCLVLYLRVTFF